MENRSNKFMNYLNDNKLLHEKQSGFRAGHSTDSDLILLIDSWLKSINDGKIVGCVMIYIQTAFDLVDHAVLLMKSEIYKCGKIALSWFILCAGMFRPTEITRYIFQW